MFNIIGFDTGRSWVLAVLARTKKYIGQAEATKVRQAEHADYLKASGDFRDSAAAVAKAIDVLSEYYGGASFVQATLCS